MPIPDDSPYFRWTPEMDTLERLIYVDANGERKVGVANSNELHLAERLLRDRNLWAYADVKTLAAVLAAVREGSTMTGRRETISSEYHVATRWDAAEEAYARERLRVHWVETMTRSGLRPVGWPSIVRKRLKYGADYSVPVEHAGFIVAADDEPADLICLKISGPAVPE